MVYRGTEDKKKKKKKRMELPRRHLLREKRKRQGQDLGKLQHFGSWQRKRGLGKRWSWISPRGIYGIDAKGLQVGVATYLFQRRKWNLGSGRAGIPAPSQGFPMLHGP